MNNDIKKIFTHSACPSEDILLRYAEGRLSETEKKAVESHLIDCEMCNDELEGLMLLEEHSHINDIESDLNSRIDILTGQEKKTNFSFILKIAASILLFVGLSTIVYFQVKTDKKVEIAENTEDIPIVEEEGVIIDSVVASEDSRDKINDETTVIEEVPFQPRESANKSSGAAYQQPQTVYIYSDISQEQSDFVFSLPEQSKADTKTDSDKQEKTAESRNDRKEENDEENLSKNTDIVPVSFAESVEITATSGKKKAVEKEKNNKNRRKDTAVQSEPPANDAEPLREATGTTAGYVSGGNGLNTIQELELAIENINNENYNIALQFLETPKLKESKDENVQYYKAFCYYKIGNYQKAHSIFKDIKNSDSALKYDIQWYYALTLIALDKKNDAVKQLEDIINSSSPFTTEAQKELDKLK